MGNDVVAPEGGGLQARQVRFELGEGAGHFCPSQPEFSHAANAFFAALPVLEPYFIHNIRQAMAGIEDPVLQAQVRGFNAQEGRHAQQHRALNAILAQRYPELPRLEREIEERLERSREHDSLAYRMAYTAGYEAITYHLVAFMMEKRALWLADADPAMFALICWHGAEEVEHKNVAFDVFQRMSGSYPLRVAGFAAALVTTVKDLRKMMRYMLTADGLWSQPACQRNARRVRIAFGVGLLPRILRYLRPGYHPSQYADPPELRWWIERYAAGDDLRRIRPEALDAALASATRA
jgi:predicted metal-dependent hydrolase